MLEYTSEDECSGFEGRMDKRFNPYFIGIHIGSSREVQQLQVLLKFQSLFYWNTHRKFHSRNIIFFPIFVSILILLEYTSEALDSTCAVKKFASFNPYFIGIHIGRFLALGSIETKDIVSILILLEYTSEDSNSGGDEREQLQVSILILLEYTSEALIFVSITSVIISFNPYFIGIHIGSSLNHTRIHKWIIWFQSLFYWNTHRKRYFLSSNYTYFWVSILILLEYTSEEQCLDVG